MRCRCCSDFATHLDSECRPVCQECYLELEYGIVSWIKPRSEKPGRPSIKEDDSPGWHNMIRALEDQSAADESLLI